MSIEMRTSGFKARAPLAQEKIATAALGRPRPDVLCAAIASSQHGVLSRAQALSQGLKSAAVDRRIRTGRWERLRPGVYRVAGAPESPEQRLMATCLWAGDGSVVSHASAGRLWKLHGVPEPGEPELTVALGQAPSAPDVRVHRTSALAAQDRTLVDGVPVTRVTRTLIDLAAVLPEDKLELACADAFRRRLSSPDRVRGRLRQLGAQGRRGIRALSAVLDRMDPAQAQTQSVLESRVLQALRRGKLPTPVLQHVVTDGDVWLGQVDFAYPERRVLIEADGRRFHQSPSAWERDLERSSELASAGWTVLRVSWKRLKIDEHGFVAQVRRALTT